MTAGQQPPSDESGARDVVAEAKALLKAKKANEAVALLEQALATNPDYADAHDQLATIYFLANVDHKSAAHFERVTRLRPADGKAFVNLGAVLNRMGEHEKAAEALRKGIQKDKKSALGFYNLGIAQKSLNQLSLAVSAYREAIRIDPQMADAHLNLANALRDMGNTRAAKEHYRKALELRPGFEAAERGLAKTEATDKQAQAGLSPFGRLVDETQAQGGAQLAGTGRQLSLEERFEDRQQVYLCMANIEAATHDLIAHLKGALDKQVSAMHRAVVEDLGGANKGGFKSMSLAHDDYKAALNATRQLRRLMKRKVLEFRGYEEMRNTPELKSE